MICAALEHGPQKRVLNVTLEGFGLPQRNQLRKRLPIGRVVEPADAAALAVNIMTNTAITVATYDVDGGQQFVAVWPR